MLNNGYGERFKKKKRGEICTGLAVGWLFLNELMFLKVSLPCSCACAMTIHLNSILFYYV